MAMVEESTLEEATRRVSRVNHVMNFFQEHPVYLWCALTIPVVSQFINYLSPTHVVFKGQPLSIIFSLLGSSLVFLTWIPFKSKARWTKLGFTTLVLIICAYGLQMILIQADDSLFNLTVVVTGAVAVLLLLKPPTQNQSASALIYFCYLIALEAAASLFLDHFGLAPSGFRYDRVGWSRLPFISDVLGIDTRWEGPFGNVNYAGPVGAFVLLIGLTTRGRNRITLIFAGAFILLLSQARNSLVALGAGILVLILTSPRVRNAAHAGLIRLLVIGGGVAATVVYIIFVDPTMGLRTDVWRDYITLARENLMTGAGDSGITAYLSSTWHLSTNPPNHAHSVLLDLTARYGLAMGILSLIILVSLVILSLQRTREYSYIGLVLIVFVIVGGLAETLYSWIYLSVQFIPLLSVLILTGTRLKADEIYEHN